MAFFSRFGTNSFTFDNKTFTLEDLTKHVVNMPLNVFNNVFRQQYYIPQGMRPDQLATKLYDDPNLWWTFFVANNITTADWPLDETELQDFIDDYYGLVKQHDLSERHVVWYTTIANDVEIFHGSNEAKISGFSQFTINHASKDSVLSTVDELTEFNDSKREIKIVTPELVRQFEADFFELIK